MTLLPKDKHYSRHTPSGLTNSIFLHFVRICTVRLLYTICNISRIFLYYVYALSTTVPAPGEARRDVNVAAPHHRRGTAIEFRAKIHVTPTPATSWMCPSVCGEVGVGSSVAGGFCPGSAVTHSFETQISFAVQPHNLTTHDHDDLCFAQDGCPMLETKRSSRSSRSVRCRVSLDVAEGGPLFDVGVG